MDGAVAVPYFSHVANLWPKMRCSMVTVLVPDEEDVEDEANSTVTLSTVSSPENVPAGTVNETLRTGAHTHTHIQHAQ